MIKVKIPKAELYNQSTNEFIYIKEKEIALEHSLVSISKWESKWHIPFISDKPKTREQTLDYLRCMTLTQNVDPIVYRLISAKDAQRIRDYIDDSMTATWFSEEANKPKRSREVVTSELIYYWMIAAGIPFECEKWHLNRLMTLIKICGEKNQPAKKMSKRDIMARNAALNTKRRAALKSKG